MENRKWIFVALDAFIGSERQIYGKNPPLRGGVKIASAPTNTAKNSTIEKPHKYSQPTPSLPPLDISVSSPLNSTLPTLPSIQSNRKKSFELPPLNFIWECPNIKHLPGQNGPLSKMQCMYCNKIFATAHHTCMLHHVLKVPNALTKCKGTVPPAYHQRYLQLYNSLKEKSGSKKRAADDNLLIVSNLQSNAVSTLQSSKKST